MKSTLRKTVILPIIFHTEDDCKLSADDGCEDCIEAFRAKAEIAYDASKEQTYAS